MKLDKQFTELEFLGLIINTIKVLIFQQRKCININKLFFLPKTNQNEYFDSFTEKSHSGCSLNLQNEIS